MLYVKKVALVLHFENALKLPDDGGRIHPAEESEVPAKNEMDYCDFQLANVGKPSLPPYVWHKVLIQDVEPQNLRKTGCNLLIHSTIFICVLDEGGWITPAEESEVPAKNEMDYSDFQLANVGQPSSYHVLAQVADPRCGTSELAQDGLQFIQFIPQSSCGSLVYLLRSVKIMEEFFRLAHKNTGKPANCVYIVYKSKMHVYCTIKMHASCMMMMDGYILLKNLKFQQRMKCLTLIFSWLISGGNLLLVFWNEFRIQDLEHRNSYKTGCNFFQFIPCSSYDDDGWIRPAEEYLANTRQPSPHILSQVADARCGTSKLVHDGLQFFQSILRSSYDDNGRIHSAEESEFPVKNEMCYSDFQLANIRQPPPPVLTQFVTQDVECRNSRKMGCIFPIHRTLFIWKHFPVIRFNIQMDIVINGCGPVLRLRITIEGWFPWVSVKLEGDGGWIHPDEESDFLVNNEVEYSDIQLASIRQPSPPPVLAKISDPRHGTSELAQDGLHFTNSYHDLHISARLMEDFLRLAVQNTAMNLETCGVLAGSLRNRVFQVTTLIIPKQESTSYSCQTLNEEEIFEVQDNNSLFSLGWIHTHPTQTCFMSSVDLHTHFSYQVMLREAIAIVMAPTDKSSPHGIFHLSDPAGVGLIRNCEERGFHPHYEPEDGSPIYERCSHVYIDPCLKHDVIDLR